MSLKSKTIQLVINGRDRTRKAFKGVIKGLKGFSVSVLKITAGISAGFAAIGFGLKKFADQIDQQSKAADKLGVTYAALSTLSDAADMAGISTNTMTMALQRMVRRVSEAASGTGEAKDAIKELGLNAEELNKKTPDKALQDIIKALEGVKNQSDRVRLAFKLFDSEGVSMVNLTSKGLREASKDASTLGLKLTEAQRKGVESANDSWSKIKNAASDFLKYVTAKLAPGIKTGFDKAFEWLKTKDLQVLAGKVAKGIGTAFQAAAVILGGVAEAIIAISRGLNGAVSIVNNLTKTSLTELLNRHVKDLDKIKEKIKELQQLGGSGGAEMRDLMQQKDVKERSIRDTYKALGSAQQVEKTTAAIAKNLEKAQGFTTSPESMKAMQTLNGLVGDLGENHKEAGKKAVAAEKEKTTAADLATAAYKRQLETVRQLNAELLRGKVGGTLSTVDSLANTLDDEADK